MNPVPQPQVEGEYPDTQQFPLRRLRATCLSHWGEVVVGEPFRWSNENIRLSPTQETSFDQWFEWERMNILAFGFPKAVWLHCKVCQRRTRHTPKGLDRQTV